VFAILPQADTVGAVEALQQGRVDRATIQVGLNAPDAENN
jgi:hypothetical protein